MTWLLLLASVSAQAALRSGGVPGLTHPEPGVYLFDVDGNGKPDRFEVDWSANRSRHGFNVDITLVDDAGETLLEDGFFISDRDYDRLFDLAAGEKVPKAAEYFGNFLSLDSGPNALEVRALEDEEVKGVSFTCLGDREPGVAAADRCRTALARDTHAVLSYARATREDGYTLVYARPLDRLACVPDAE